ncbi:MAG: hypothetical protein J1F36_02170 [Clostridiales bacterium]|nr:hypothetical protein [Clostridiales bacterium]
MEEQFLSNFIQKFQGDEELYNKFLDALRSGNNKVFHNFVAERFALDDKWIYTIEGVLFSIETIVRNPRRFIKEDHEVVAVEKAKRTNANTVRHLASHTQNIQAFTENNVRPSKVLVTEIEEDLAIYENRFVYALIERVYDFVERRYSEISDKAKNFDKTNLKMHSAFKMGESDFECSFDIKVNKPSDDEEAAAKLNEQLEKIDFIRRRIHIIKNSEFCRIMAKAKPVKPPIQKTNMLRMNVDYRNCYQLWLFISSYNTMGYSAEITEKVLPVEGDYYDDLTAINTLALESLVLDGNLRRDEYASLPITKRTERHYKVVQNYKYDPDFGADTNEQGEDAVNEYYFRQMRNELIRAIRRNQMEEDKELDLNFRHFFRAIAKINGEMYKDIITSEYEKQPKGRTAIQAKEAAVKNQKVLLKRYHQLAQLQKQELEKTLKLEKREILKLEKLQKDLAKEKKRRIDNIEKNKTKKLKALEAQTRLAQKTADKYEKERREADAAKEAKREERLRQRREKAKRDRELKKLQELKDKYDGETK